MANSEASMRLRFRPASPDEGPVELKFGTRRQQRLAVKAQEELSKMLKGLPDLSKASDIMTELDERKRQSERFMMRALAGPKGPKPWEAGLPERPDPEAKQSHHKTDERDNDRPRTTVVARPRPQSAKSVRPSSAKSTRPFSVAAGEMDPIDAIALGLRQAPSEQQLLDGMLMPPERYAPKPAVRRQRPSSAPTKRTTTTSSQAGLRRASVESAPAFTSNKYADIAQIYGAPAGPKRADARPAVLRKPTPTRKMYHTTRAMFEDELVNALWNDPHLSVVSSYD